MDDSLRRALEQYPDDGYLHYHAPRYDSLLTLLHRYSEGCGRVLDIGRSRFCDIAHASLQLPVDTLGFEPDRGTSTGHNYQFDLNNTQSEADWRKDLPRYQIIVFCEVLEHLYTAPSRVLAFLKSLLVDDGVIILQTPNAVVLHKRLQMLLGRNPFNLIAEDTTNPAHFREYTARELCDYCGQVNLSVELLSYENYFDYQFSGHVAGPVVAKPRNRLVNMLYSVLPRSMRAGLCLVLRA